MKTYNIIHKLVNYRFDPELRDKIWQWLTSTSNQKEKEEALLSIWNEYPTVPTADTYRSLKVTQEKIRQLNKTKKQYVLVRFLVRAAAVLAIPLLSMVASYLYIDNQTHNPEQLQCYVPIGEKTLLTLPDGTLVNINSGSVLIYPEEFKGKNRTVYLSGEANFSVAKDKEHPFIVSTNHLKIQALGTKFNIKAYSDSDKITTTLENGAVKVEKIIGDNDSYILSPDEQLEYNYKTNVFAKRNISAANFSGWTKGELNFVNQTLKEILATLERKYALDFRIDPGLLTSDLYTIKFNQQESIETIMKILTMTVGKIDYEIKNDTINIHRLIKKGANK